jgi:hypothetical protein
MNRYIDLEIIDDDPIFFFFGFGRLDLDEYGGG